MKELQARGEIPFTSDCRGVICLGRYKVRRLRTRRGVIEGRVKVLISFVSSCKTLFHVHFVLKDLLVDL